MFDNHDIFVVLQSSVRHTGSLSKIHVEIQIYLKSQLNTTSPTFIMNKIFIQAPKITRQMATDTIWICYSSCTSYVFRMLQEYLSVGHTKLNQMFSGVSKSPTIGVRGAMGRVNLRVWREIFVHRSWSLITQIACRRNPKAHFLLQSAKHNISNCIPNLREELQGSVYELCKSEHRQRRGQ